MNFRVIFLLMLLMCYCKGKAFSNLNNQTRPIPDKGLEGFQLAKQKIDAGLYDEGKVLYIASIPYLQASQHFSQQADAMLDLAVLYHWEDSTELAFKYLLEAKSILETRVGTQSALYGVCLTNLSALYYSKRQVEKGISIEQKALTILEGTNFDRSFVASLLINIALSRETLGDYLGANKDLRRAIQYLKEEDLPSIDLCRAYHFLGLMHMYLKDYEVAIPLLNHTLKQLDNLSTTEEVIELRIQTLQRLASSHKDLEDFTKAKELLVSALSLQETNESHRKYLSFEIMADVELNEKNYPAAIKYSKKALNLAKVSYGSFKKHPVIARQYTHLGEIYQANNQLDSAVHYFHQAFLYLAHGFENANIHATPKAEQCFMEYKVIRSLRGKAKAMYLRFKESKDLRDLQTSLETYELTHEFIKKLKEDITTMGSKQRLAGDALPIYEEAITAALALHEVTGKRTYLEKALFFAESNKAILLLESMNERMAQSVSGIPDSLLQQEKQFRIDIAYYEKEINDERNKKETEPKPEKLKRWEDKLYTLRREYQQLIDQFEEQYPKYYRLKYDTKLATVQDIRRDMLSRKTAFLEYFVGVENIYLFEITKKNFSVHQFPKSAAFEQNIHTIHGMVKKTQLSTEEIPIFQAKIRELYVQYLASSIEQLPKSINRLLIVPDDLLNLVPFEILSRTESKAEYLIQDFTIGYAYSASLFQAGRKSDREVAEQLFLGYAPAFSAPFAENRNCAGDRLSNLANSQREVEGIQALLGGDVVVGTMANRDSFLKQASHYRIIHLATHACMDKENPMQSKVFFADDPIVNQDLFNLNLAADLAVLSACNTGSGQLVKGDGVLSLSKGFVHAGCPSAVISLWSVDDFSASEIMIDFYAYLKKGFSKDKALRQAKLNFITTADKVKKHPFFWAAFVQMGDPRALDFGQQIFPWRLLSILAILLLAGVFLLWRNHLAKIKLSLLFVHRRPTNLTS